MKIYKICVAVSFIVITAGLSQQALSADPVTPQLTDKLSRLLQQEMRSIQGAMASIHVALVTGEHEKVATTAQQVHDSFILAQALTEQDREDLMAAVPQGFLKLDKDFHKLAERLVNAAEDQDTQQQFTLYSEMTQSCIACHSQYVADRFGGLVTK